jgi:hypothetical protein
MQCIHQSGAPARRVLTGSFLLLAQAVAGRAQAFQKAELVVKGDGGRCGRSLL